MQQRGSRYNPNSFLVPLQHPLFRALWIANGVSHFGTWMHNTGAAWLLATLTPSPMMVALLQTASTLPIFLFAIPAGVIADLTDRPRFLFYAQAFMAVVATVMGFVTAFGGITPQLLLLFTALLAVGSAISLPAWQAGVLSLVDPQEIPAAASLNNLSFNIARSLGPAVAGWVLALFGTASVFFINALSFSGILVVFWKWSLQPQAEKNETETLRSAFKGAFLNIHRSQLFRNILIRTASIFFFSSALWSLVPLIARDHFHTGVSGFGYLMGSLGLGAIISTLILPNLRRKIAVNKLITSATFLLALFSSFSILTNSLPLSCFFLICCGIAWATLISQFNSATQLAFEIHSRSRAAAVYLVVLYGSIAFGSVIFGKSVGLFGLSSSLQVASLGLALSCFLARRYSIR